MNDVFLHWRKGVGFRFVILCKNHMSKTINQTIHKKYVLGGLWFSAPPSFEPRQFYSTVVLQTQTI